MPGIILCWRRWGVASDDFVYPAAGEVIIRIIWLVALAAVLGVHNNFICNPDGDGQLLLNYYQGTIAILAVVIVLDIIIIVVSARGTIENAAPRRHLTKILYVKLFTFVPEIIWTGLGTSWAFSASSSTCPVDVLIIAKIAAIVGWFLLLVLLILIFLVFDPIGSHRHRHSDISDAHRNQHWLWKLRCKLICCGCCCTPDDKTNAFDDVAQLLTTYFSVSSLDLTNHPVQQDLDFVPTDVASALILVKRQQQSTRFINARNDVASVATLPHAITDLEYPEPAEWMTINLAFHFMKFALASYGWMFFVYENRVCGPCRLWCRCRCCSCLNDDQITGENCFACNTAAILEQTRISRVDIIFASFDNDLYKTPFYVALDHKTKSVVVSIRGTLSFNDALTDMSVHSDNVDVTGVPAGSKAHRGILKAADNIKREIANKGLIDRAFSYCPDYQLVITGHSLGAGAAALLAVLLRPTYPQLRCFAYSPPGWLVSKPLLAYTDEFVCSIVVATDLVPRMGLDTFESLKQQMLNVVHESREPKYKILATGFWNALCGSSTHPASREYLYDPEQPLLPRLDSRSSSSPWRQRRYTDEQTNSPNHIEPDGNTQSAQTRTNGAPLYDCQLFMPGQVLYLDETSPATSCCGGTPTYRAMWARPETFDEIIVGASMIHDHMPNVVYRALQSLATDMHDDRVWCGRAENV